MGWTDLDLGLRHSREQVLADVLQRGERIRRRRRTATGLVGALAVLVPVLAFVSLGGGGQRRASVIAAGPVASISGSPSGSGSTLDALPASPTSTVAVDVIQPAPPTTRAGDTRSGDTGPQPTTVSTTRLDLDDPVVKPAVPPTIARAATGATAPMTPVTSISSSNSGALTQAAVPACPAAQVKITVLTERDTYAPGETVRWTSTLENASGTTCTVSGRAFFHVEDATGTTVGSFPHTADFQLPVKAEPGRTFTGSLSWDQTNCAGGPCAQVPAGTYTVVAEWTEAGPYVGRGSFSVR